MFDKVMWSTKDCAVAHDMHGGTTDILGARDCNSGGIHAGKNSKIRRINSTPEPREWMQKFYSIDKTHDVECRFSISSDLECGIMQEPTHLVAIEDLPSGWPWEEVCSSATDVAEGCTSPDVDANTMHLPCGHVFSPSTLDANTIHLPCGHVFSPSALALHFLIQDMRCPICRAGSATRMGISSVPLSIRHIYAKKIKVLEVPDHTADLEISVADIMQVVTQIHLQVLISLPRQSRLLRMNSSSTAPTESLIHSRLLANDVDLSAHLRNVQATVRRSVNTQGGALSEANAAGAPGVPAAPTDELDPSLPGQNDMASFRTHRSFQRIIQALIERQPPSATVVFVLQHPLMPLDIRSERMTVGAARASLFGEASDGSIPLMCSVISGVDPIAHVRTSRDPANDTSNLSVCINLGVVVNMAIYVSQVLEHLEAVGGEDFESALVAV